MKKVALLIGGEYRNFTQQFPTWKFLDQFDYDIFMSTWDISNKHSDKSRATLTNTKESITAEKIISVTGKTPKYLNIEEEIKFDHRGNKQIYHWQKLLTALINLQNDYEYAIITRPDIEIPGVDDFSKFTETIDIYKIYGASAINVTEPPIPFVVTINDIFFMASPKKLIDVLLPVPYMKMKNQHELNTGRGDTFHTHLAHYFVSNSIYVYQMPGGIAVNGAPPTLLKEIEMSEQLENLSREYFKSFCDKNIVKLDDMLDKDVHLTDWQYNLEGKEKVLDFNENIFKNVEIIIGTVLSVISSSNIVYAELKIQLDNNIELHVLDVIRFNDAHKIVKIDAYHMTNVPPEVAWEKKLAELRKRDPFIYR